MNTDHTLEEVGKQFDVTRERIRQIEAKHFVNSDIQVARITCDRSWTSKQPTASKDFYLMQIGYLLGRNR